MCVHPTVMNEKLCDVPMGVSGDEGLCSSERLWQSQILSADDACDAGAQRYFQRSGDKFMRWGNLRVAANVRRACTMAAIGYKIWLPLPSYHTACPAISELTSAFSEMSEARSAGLSMLQARLALLAHELRLQTP